MECPICFESYDLNENKPMIIPCSGAHEACCTCIEQLKDAQTNQFECPHCREEVDGRVNANRGMLALLEERPQRVVRQRRRTRQRPAHQQLPQNDSATASSVWSGRVAVGLIICIVTLLMRRYFLGPMPASISDVTVTLTSGVGHFSRGVSATYTFDLQRSKRVTVEGKTGAEEGVFLPFPGVRDFMLSIYSIDWSNATERALIPPDVRDPSDHLALLMSAVLSTTAGARCVGAISEQVVKEDYGLTFGAGTDDNDDPYYFELEQYYEDRDAQLIFYVDMNYADGLIMYIATKLKFDHGSSAPMYREAMHVQDLPWTPCFWR